MSKLFMLDDGASALDLALRGFGRLHSDIVTVLSDPVAVIAKQRSPGRRVGLVSGGGSGHEPLHGGFVGSGMLDAAAPGRVFASPHNRQVYAASREVAGPDGVLHIVKNYTGDRINFGIAAERLAGDGIAVRRVLVNDDIATDNADTGTGRRGTAATVLVEKILGAAADDGMSLDELAVLGQTVAESCCSLGVAARAQSTLPDGDTAFELGPDKLEYGVGIHGERAAETVDRPPLPELVDRMCTDILAKMPDDGQEVGVLINGLGSATQLELYSVFAQVTEHLDSRSERICASLVGTFVPALDMHGFSITLARLRPEWLEWLSRPVLTPFPLTVVTYV
ncbi:dihydroxyacetone kinase subunit DhaK [Mycolicibacterium mengxianglii]|uniref:dihydroxyacetone kinase subunit DhaK n=1 Tax=Mycolicibacterium mengxianglii TaxID=2736649 RepID=UPI0018EF1ADB|nr:dihydroxyacetone kinase subunit DhaK [Mycolicibacterium mengxianglii]